jgi:hypothetical protein
MCVNTCDIKFFDELVLAGPRALRRWLRCAAGPVTGDCVLAAPGGMGREGASDARALPEASPTMGPGGICALGLRVAYSSERLVGSAAS